MYVVVFFHLPKLSAKFIAINAIVQNGPVAVIASCVLDGGAEDDGQCLHLLFTWEIDPGKGSVERNMPYNSEGTLKVLYKGEGTCTCSLLLSL